MQQLLVAAVHASGKLLEVVFGLFERVLRLGEHSLGGANFGEEGTRSVPLVVQANVLHGLLDDADLVLVVVNHEVVGEAYLFGVLAQDARPQGVEGAYC